MVQLLVTCENGHGNPDDRLFCGDCGVPIVPSMAICVLGHVNLKDQHFCGDCGVPIRAPAGADHGSSGGRWNVDPSGEHQYRYWNGDKWTENVADNGTFSADPFSKAVKWHPETWVGIAAGVVTIVLVVAAMVGIASQLSGRSESASVTESSSSTSTTAEASAPPVSVPPPIDTGIRPPAVIATPCRPNSSVGLTADGSTAYCERLEMTDTFMWSLNQGDIPSPFPVGEDPTRQGDPAIAVCMSQTDRSAAQCVEYLQRPSDPGDGQPAA